MTTSSDVKVKKVVPKLIKGLKIMVRTEVLEIYSFLFIYVYCIIVINFTLY